MTYAALDIDRDATLHDAFANVTGHFQSNIQDFRTIYCFDTATDGTKLMGRTAFLRHWRVMKTLLRSFKPMDKIRILAAPASIGCEAYSLAAQCLEAGIGDVRVDTFDVSARFTALARTGRYPDIIARRMQDDDRDLLFSPAPKDALMREIRPQIKQSVRFLEPQKLEDFTPQQPYDIALVANLFIYLNDAQIRQSLDTLYASGAKVIAFTPPETPLKPDQRRFTDIRAVHPAWRSTALFDEYEFLLSMYNVWVRKDAFTRRPV